jgi:CMP-N-acetylneuraminic acid synthetase
MKIAAVTCARMDSKRFPGKCLALLDGKPLLQHTIDFARSIDIQLYTFTRDQRIIDYVKDKTPIIYEPIELYDTPHNSTYEKMQYVNRILDVDYLILLQPTQPIRWKPTIEKIIKEIIEKDIDFSFTSYEGLAEGTIERADDGAFYCYSKKSLKQDLKLVKKLFLNCYTFDIDTPEDLKECEEWLQRQK